MKIITSILITFCSILSFAQVENGLVAHFPLDSVDFTDATGTANGTVSNRGNGTFSTAADKTSTANTACNFTGGIAEAGSSSRNITNEVTISCWIKTSQLSSNVNVLVGNYNCSTNGGYFILIQDGKVSFDARDASRSLYLQSGVSQTVNDNNWHHVVGVLASSGDQSIWVDGQKANSSANGTIISLTSGCNLTLGGFSQLNTKNAAGQYLGDMDEVRIYNRALDSTEIDTLYQYPYSTTSSISDLALNKINVYPNPVENNLTVNNLDKNTNFSLINSLGQEVLKGKVLNSINTDTLINGSYTLFLYDDKGLRTGYAKFIK